MLKYSGASVGYQIKSKNILSDFWSETTYNGSIDVNLDASTIQENGSKIYLEYESSSGSGYESCEYPLTKTLPPSFTLSPQNLSLQCGDTNARLFTVSSSNIPEGANVTYSWSNNGWSVINSSSNSRTLQPISGTSLPSSVTVVPFIDGVSQPSLVSTISRASYTPSYSISGSNFLCSSSTYSLPNLASGETVTGWSVSNPSIVDVSSNGSQVTLTALSNGSLTITAEVQNACGQTADISKEIFVGDSEASGNTLIWAGTRGVSTISTTPGATHTFNVDNVSGATSYTWVLPRGFSVLGGGSTTTTSTSINITTSSTTGTYTIYCKVNNPCGFRWTNNLTVNVGSTSGGGGGSDDCPPGVRPPCRDSGPHYLSVYPNPASASLKIEALSKVSGKAKKVKFIDNKDYKYMLYDFTGKAVQEGNFSEQASLDISRLKKGNYILVLITDENEKETHHIVVQ